MPRAAGIAGIGSSHGGRQRRRRGIAILASHQRELTAPLRGNAALWGGGGENGLMHSFSARYRAYVVVGSYVATSFVGCMIQCTSERIGDSKEDSSTH